MDVLTILDDEGLLALAGAFIDVL
jgi:hypothetical protein